MKVSVSGVPEPAYSDSVIFGIGVREVHHVCQRSYRNHSVNLVHLRCRVFEGLEEGVPRSPHLVRERLVIQNEYIGGLMGQAEFSRFLIGLLDGLLTGSIESQEKVGLESFFREGIVGVVLPEGNRVLLKKLQSSGSDSSG